MRYQSIRVRDGSYWHVVDLDDKDRIYSTPQALCGVTHGRRLERFEREDGLPLWTECCATCRRIVEKREVTP